MGFFAEFKAFVMRGNVLDLAVGVIIGAAFGGVTKSLVDDVMMPPIGLAIGAVDFKELYVPLVAKVDSLHIHGAAEDKYENLKKNLLDAEIARVTAENQKAASEGKPLAPLPTSVSPTLEQVKAEGIPTLRYGLFINTIINFAFVAFGVFLVVKLMTVLQKKAPPPPPAPPAGPTKSEELLVEIRDLLKAKPAR